MREEHSCSLNSLLKRLVSTEAVRGPKNDRWVGPLTLAGVGILALGWDHLFGGGVLGTWTWGGSGRAGTGAVRQRRGGRVERTERDKENVRPLRVGCGGGGGARRRRQPLLAPPRLGSPWQRGH